MGVFCPFIIRVTLIFSFLTSATILQAQIFTRMQAEITVKERTKDKSYNLSKGTVYFDKTQNLLIYDMYFPVKRKMIIKDTLSYAFEENVLLKKQNAPNLLNYSVYNLCLNGGLSVYGLDKSPFKLIETREDSGLMISTWKLPSQYSGSKIIYKLAQKDNLLVGLLTYNEKEQLLSRQLFSEYSTIQGIKVPSKMIQYTYVDGREELKITTLHNIIINNFNDKDHYRFFVPIAK